MPRIKLKPNPRLREKGEDTKLQDNSVLCVRTRACVCMLCVFARAVISNPTKSGSLLDKRHTDVCMVYICNTSRGCLGSNTKGGRLSKEAMWSMHY